MIDKLRKGWQWLTILKDELHKTGYSTEKGTLTGLLSVFYVV